jgi:hypothetical protein
MRIEITRVTASMYVVNLILDNGYAHTKTAGSCMEARIYANGLSDGFNAVKNAIGLGPRVNPVVLDPDGKPYGEG